MATEPHWTVYFTLITPFAAAAAAYVAYKFGRIQAGIAKQQAETALIAAKTARNKLKLDLFKDRLVVYDAVRKYIDYAMLNNTVESNDQWKYLSDTRSAKWIFDDPINEFLQVRLYQKLLELVQNDTKIDQFETDPKIRADHINDRARIKQELIELSRDFDELCKPYLHLSH